MSFRSIRGGGPGGGKAKTKYELRTLARCWEEFRTRAIPPDAPALEVSRARMCFYAGAAFMFDQNMAVGEAAEVNGLSEDECVTHLQAIGAELQEYRRELEAENKARGVH